MVALTDGSGAYATAGAPACEWSITTAPNPRFADLRDIDGSGPDNIWAVGSADAGGAPLAMHWNGRRWATVPTPDRSNLAGLEGVAVSSRRNAWAVGWTFKRSRLTTLILHWDGDRWSRTPSPNPLAGPNLLFGVAIAGPQRAFAVGTNNGNSAVGSRTIILRWTGTRWVNDHPSPTEGALSGVAVQSNAIMAVGTSRETLEPLVERRTASGWTDQEVVPDDLADLLSVDAAGAGPFRGVGQGPSHPGSFGTWAMHSTPGGWVNDTAPNKNDQINVLYDVSARTASQAWAVGYYERPSFLRRTLTLRFASGTWSIVDSPNPNGRHTELNGVYAVPGSNVVWAVGRKSSAVASHPLVMQFHC
jgi:hypothetical protein